MHKIVFFPQGGMGNQIIQHAYAAALCVDTQCTVEVNPVLLSKAFSNVTGISWRQPSPLLSGFFPSIQSRRAKAVGLMCLLIALRQNQCINDTYDHARLQSILSNQPSKSQLFMSGYFQRSPAFTGGSQSFWSFLAGRLIDSVNASEPYPYGQVVVHVRLGDYRKPENTKLFIQPSFDELLATALEWRSALGATMPIHVVTDDPGELSKELSFSARDDVVFLGGFSALEDFSILARHQHLVISNSTFSLCAGRLAAELWNLTTTVAHPGHWFVDPILDFAHQRELEKCSFCTTFSLLRS